MRVNGACLFDKHFHSLFVSNEHVVSNEHTAMTENKKGKIESEGRVFNLEWTSEYLFTEANSKILCLVFRNVVSVAKEYNLRRHFETNLSNLVELDINEKSHKQNVYLPNLARQNSYFRKNSYFKK